MTELAPAAWNASTKGFGPKPAASVSSPDRAQRRDPDRVPGPRRGRRPLLEAPVRRSGSARAALPRPRVLRHRRSLRQRSEGPRFGDWRSVPTMRSGVAAWPKAVTFMRSSASSVRAWLRRAACRRQEMPPSLIEAPSGRAGGRYTASAMATATSGCRLRPPSVAARRWCPPGVNQHSSRVSIRYRPSGSIDRGARMAPKGNSTRGPLASTTNRDTPLSSPAAGARSLWPSSSPSRTIRPRDARGRSSARRRSSAMSGVSSLRGRVQGLRDRCGVRRAARRRWRAGPGARARRS